ncbi:YtxH domain-containing protein [Vagococcus sp. PNs007]|uniref:YtxH domain-containing protein n=1 Tax=Vagococcus proximus TaxID=2991417 RepID=A0ABT5X2S5_9ENTE|nr:YtxH domain-containing protein [Vagococcus proximus]MDF0480292.1 YtxH domain-containing protein [Vagococcus proximus]
MSKKSNGFLSGLIVGGAAAAAAALLFAPKSGKDLRDELTEKTNDFTSNENNPEFVNQAISKASILKDKAVKTSNDAFTTIKNQSSELAKKVKTSTDDDMMSFEEAMDLMDRELEEQEEDIVIDLSETTEEVTEEAEEMAEVVSDTVDEILEDVSEEN